MSVARAGAVVASASLVLLLFAPSRALAGGGWSWPCGSQVSLAYGAAYPGAGGKTCTHGGIDIPASAGERVRASVAGHVTFAGAVPSGEGARSLAVTLLTSDGLKVTFLPLSATSVRTGADVAAGHELGSLASQGDASTSGSHLHMSVRRGETYLDPASMLAPPAASGPGDVVPDGPGGSSEGKSPGSSDARPSAQGSGASARQPAASADPAVRVARPSGARAGRWSVPQGAAGARLAVQRGTHAMLAAPGSSHVAAPALPPLVRLGGTVSALAGARTGAAWWIVRLMIAVAALGCARPLVNALRPRAAPSQERVRA